MTVQLRKTIHRLRQKISQPQQQQQRQQQQQGQQQGQRRNSTKNQNSSRKQSDIQRSSTTDSSDEDYSASPTRTGTTTPTRTGTRTTTTTTRTATTAKTNKQNQNSKSKLVTTKNKQTNKMSNNRRAQTLGRDIDTDLAAEDKKMEEKASRAMKLLSMRYSGMKHEQEAKLARKMELEKKMIGLPEDKKKNLRRHLEQEEAQISKESRKNITTSDFESLAVVGRGAFGEVRLVRRKPPPSSNSVHGPKNSKAAAAAVDPLANSKIYALKSMKKEMMVMKNQVGHVKAERDVLATADDNNRWLTVLHYSFQDESHLYMVMEFMPGGDLMSLLMKEDTFSENVTKFFMAEAAHAISSVHALGYVHRDIKPDNMLLDAKGHLKLTDLGLCKKVGEVSPEDHPEVVLEMLGKQGHHGKQEELRGEMLMDMIDGNNNSNGPTTINTSTGPRRIPPKTTREMAYSTVGTPDYIAPEVLAAQNGSSGYSYTVAVDWWSLGVIMYECLVGYTPFYAEDPVTTCRKILRWRQCLEMPAETRSQLSIECIDFLSCLLAGPETRIGSSVNGSTEFENGFVQVVQHPWFAGFDWTNLNENEGPLLPSGSREFPELLEILKTCPKSDRRFNSLVERVTQNFDTFEDYGSNLDSNEGRRRVDKNALDQFYDYQFRRTRKPNIPL